MLLHVTGSLVLTNQVSGLHLPTSTDDVQTKTTFKVNRLDDFVVVFREILEIEQIHQLAAGVAVVIQAPNTRPRRIEQFPGVWVVRKKKVKIPG